MKTIQYTNFSENVSTDTSLTKGLMINAVTGALMAFFAAFFFFPNAVSGQCSVNAGANQTICTGGSVGLSALGTSSGGGSSNSLTTTFAGGNSQNGNFFDITALNTVTINGMSGNLPTGTHTIQIYYRAGTHIGFEGSAANWILVGQTSVVSAGNNVPTPVPINIGVTIPAGQTYGWYFTISSGATVNYTNGGTLGAVFVQDANIQIREGRGAGYPFGGLFTTRVWNGVVNYSACLPYNFTTPIQAITTTGGSTTFTFPNTPAAASGNGTLTVRSRGDFDLTSELLDIIGEGGTNIGVAQGNAQCSPTQFAETFTITQAQINAWAANGSITITADASSNVNTICSNNDVQMILSYPVSGVSSYSWSPSAGLSNANVPNPTASPSSTTTYTVTYSDGCGCTATDQVVVSVVPDPSVTISGGGTVCSGGNLTLNASASGGTGTCSYQWQRATSAAGPWTNVGTNSSSYNTGTLTSTFLYRVIRSCSGTGCGTATSNTQTVTVVPDPSVSIAGGGTICAGGSLTLSASASGGTGTCSYQWQQSASSAGPWSNVGTNSSTYNTGALSSSFFYRVIRSCSGGGCGTATSNLQAVSVVSDPSVSITGGGTICSGGNQTLTASASGGTGTCSYQWQRATSAAGPWTNVGTNSSSYNTGALTTTFVYRVVRSCTGTGCDAANSNTQTVTVVPDPSVTVSGGQEVCPGSAITLTASASGGTGTCNFQWQSASNPAGPWTNVGTNSSSYTTAPLNATTYYRVIRSCSGSDCGTATSNTVAGTIDFTSPNAVCQSRTVVLNASGSGTVSAAQVNNGSSDNCGGAGLSLSLSQTSFNCSNVGTNTVTLTATDQSGNSDNCTATITVQDNSPPQLNCQNFSAPIGANGSVTVSLANVTSSSSDNCGVANSSISPSTFTCADLGGTFPVLVTVTDAAGNSNSCTAQVTVTDPGSNCNQPPVAVCQNITVSADANCVSSVPASAVDGGSSDSDGDPLSFSISPNGPFFTGTSTVTLTVSDPSNSSDTCTATITVEDVLAPNAVCQDLTVQLNAAGTATFNANQIDNGSTDNCGIGSFSASPNTFFCSDVGNNAVTLNVIDINGNSSTCSANVTVEDLLPPTAVCQDLTVQVGATGTGTITAGAVDNGSSDNCSVSSLLLSGSSFSCSDVGVNSVNLTVVDVNGNSSVCSANITVEDNSPPTAVCQNLTVTLNNQGTASVPAANVDGGSSDFCGIQSFILSQSNFNCTDIGVVGVTLTVIDNNGNFSTCTSSLEVVDAVNPTVVCQNVTVQLDGNGQATVTAADIDGGSSDACGIASLAISNGSFNCSSLGANTVSLSAADVNGNFGICSATVTVEDTVAPTIICPPNATVSNDAGLCGAVVNWAAPNASDNCGVGSVSGSANSGSFFAIGNNTVTYVVTDNNGLQDTCTFNVDVADTEPPVLVCPPNLSFVADSATCSAVVNWNAPSITDNCAIDTSFSSLGQGGNLGAGSYTVTYVATDVNGNTNSCSFSISVAAAPLVAAVSAPAFPCGDNVSCNGAQDGQADLAFSGGCGPYSLQWSNGGTSNTITGLGAGIYTVTVTDNQGNTAVDSVEITEPAPLQALISGDTLLCSSDSTGGLNLAVTGGNACSPYQFLWSNGAVTQNLSNIGSGLYAVTVTDASGCTALADQEILSAPAPVVTLGSDTVICTGIPLTLDAGAGFASYSWSNGGQTQSVSVSAPGTYTVTVTNSVGCEGVDSVLIGQFATADTIIQPRQNLVVCQSDTLVLNADPGFSGYIWSTGDSGPSTSVFGQGGTISVIATDSDGCEVRDTVEVSFNNSANPVPVLLPSNNVILCEGTTVTLSVVGIFPDYTWSNGGTTNSIQVSAPGQFNVTVTNAAGCRGVSDTAVVTEVPNPMPTFTYQGGVLAVNGVYASYQWFRDGTLIPGGTQPTYIPQLAGTFSVTVVDANGCEGSSDGLFVDPTVSAEGATDRLLGLELFPNPTTGILNVRTESPINWDVDIQVTDMYGKVVKEFRVDFLLDVIELDLRDVANGMYLLRVVDAKGRSNMLRFMVE